MAEFNTDQIISYYTKSAPLYSLFWYDKESLGLHYGYTRTGKESLTEQLLSAYKDFLEWVKPNNEYRILDAGCGVGGGALWMRQHAEGIYTGISITPEQIGQAIKHLHTLSEEIQDSVSFEIMDYTKTAFSDGSFDAVYGQESFCHTYPSPHRLFGEMWRILKPGGKFFMVDGVLLRHPDNEYEESVLNGMYAGWKLNGGMTPQEIISVLQSVGFNEIEFFNKSDAIESSTRKMFWLGIVSRPVMWALYKLKIISSDVYGNARTLICQKQAQKLGLMGYGIIRAVK